MNFTDIMDESIANVERPPLAPIGSYVMQIIKLPDQRELTSDKGSWDVIEFASIRVIRPGDDVDPEAFASWGGKPGDIQGLRKTFMFDKSSEVSQKQTLANLKEFIRDHCGVNISGMSTRQALNAAVNQQFLGVVGYRSSEDGRQFYQLGKSAPVA